MSEHHPRVLVLLGKSSVPQQAVENLSEHFEVEVHHDVDAAMAALRSGEGYDAVFAEAGDFLPLERALVDQQARRVLETIGEGVCVVDDAEQCVWANQRMQSFPPDVRDRVQQTCASARSLFARSRAARADWSSRVDRLTSP